MTQQQPWHKAEQTHDGKGEEQIIDKRFKRQRNAEEGSLVYAPEEMHGRKVGATAFWKEMKLNPAMRQDYKQCPDNEAKRKSGE